VHYRAGCAFFTCRSRATIDLAVARNAGHDHGHRSVPQILDDVHAITYPPEVVCASVARACA
jgi:hypothetical protein